jgi:alkylation response protein AidB-like acyl-CoA dehydrogenase
MTTVADDARRELEDVARFRARARAWIRENLKPVDRHPGEVIEFRTDQQELAEVARQRAVQRMLFDAGFAGLVVPRKYGGAGLTPAHVQVFNEEIVGYDYPYLIQVANFSPSMAVILEFGTEEQKLRHVPAILRGEELFATFLSEPSGGSDVAGARTTAVRDGEEWVLTGSKIWSSFAWWRDWGLCLTRTNWDVEKHRGLTVFMVPVRWPGIELRRIEMANGPGHFCQEFFTDARIPDANRIGAVGAGWNVGVRWMFYERSRESSPYITWWATGGGMAGLLGQYDLVHLARRSGRIHDPLARDLIGEVRAAALVAEQTATRIVHRIRTGDLNDQAAALIRLQRGVNGTRQATVAFELAAGSAVAWDEADEILGRQGLDFLTRQAGQIGGGTTEMARNVISERVLGMPRERAGDQDVAYRDVPQGPAAGR